MATDHTIQSFTAADIDRYHQGLLSPAERHALEKAALDDPFLADALEGYGGTAVNVTADLAELKDRLAVQTGTDRPVIAARASSFPWLRAAAMIVLLAGAGWLTYKFAFDTKEKNIANTDTKETTAQHTDTDTVVLKDGENIPLTDSAAAGNIVTLPVTGMTDTISTFSGRRIELETADSIRTVTASEPVTIARQAAPDTTKHEEAQAEKTLVQAPPPVLPERSFGYDKKSNLSSKENNNDAAFRKGKADNYKGLQNLNRFRGRVTDADNNGIPFANVSNSQDNVGTYTDARGYFNLTSTADSILDVNVRALGFNANSTRLRNSLPNNQVVMQEDQSIAPQTLSSQKVNYEQRRSRDVSMKLEGEPEPADGWDNYDSYLTNNINEDLKTKQTASGQVEISFEVSKSGEPVNTRVEKSLCTRCDQEAIRLVKEGPKWKRKTRKGRTRVTISF